MQQPSPAEQRARKNKTEARPERARLVVFKVNIYFTG